MDRMRRIEAWSYYQGVLTNAVQAEKGKLACIDTATGLVTNGAASATLIPIGYFDERLLGDGTLEVRVQLFQEVWIHWFDNDVATPVVVGDVMSDCYILDDETVTGDATGASVAGRVWAISSVEGVGVEMRGFSAS